MKPPILLAALLLLPASVAYTPQQLPYRPGTSVQQATAAADAGAAVVAASIDTAPSWQWPLVPRPEVLRAFDPPPKPWMSGHRGVDLAAASRGRRWSRQPRE